MEEESNLPKSRGDDAQADYRVSLIVIAKSAENEYGLCDELIYAQNLEEAKAKQNEIHRRRGECKRRVIVVQPHSESRNFSAFR